jgi:hypothetical protein
MPHNGLRSNLFLTLNRQLIHLCQCIQRCFKGGTFFCSSNRPTLRTSRCRRSYLIALYMFVSIGCLITLILSNKLKNTDGPFLFSKKFFRPENVQSILCCFYLFKFIFLYIIVPRYLLLGVDGKSKCKSIFEHSVPYNLRRNITDKELIDSLIGKKINLAYVIQSDVGENAPTIQGKFCSNSSNEWMILSIFDKGKIIYFDFVYLSLIL